MTPTEMHIDALMEKIEELKELHRMQLVACSTAALANTEKSKEFRIGKENPYWTPAYQDVCDAVDREIRYREALERIDSECSRDDTIAWGIASDALEALKEME